MEAATYIWQSNLLLSCNTCERPTVVVSQAGEVLLYLNPGTPCESVCTYRYTVRQPTVYVPNAFSPNRDGINDHFAPYSSDPLLFELQVFGRWGEHLYEEASTAPRWDGTFRGQPVDNGTYVYVVRYADPATGEAQVLTGTFVLMR